MSDNIPCKNPAVCKVQSHRPGTVAKCARGKLVGHTPSKNYLSMSAKVKLASSQPAEGHILNEDDLNSAVRQILDNPKTSELGRSISTPHSSESGERYERQIVKALDKLGIESNEEDRSVIWDRLSEAQPRITLASYTNAGGRVPGQKL